LVLALIVVPAIWASESVPSPGTPAG